MTALIAGRGVQSEQERGCRLRSYDAFIASTLSSLHTFFTTVSSDHTYLGNMGRKAFCVPALVSSFLAVVLLLLCTVSTPTTFHTSTPFNFVQASDLGNITDTTPGANQDRQLSGLKVRAR